MLQKANRRTVLRGVVAIAAFYLTGARNRAQAQPAERVRYGVHTPEGKAMLSIYADGVRAMMDTKRFTEGDPRSWMFQWYTHSVRADRTKQNEIQRVYKGDPSGALAEAMWNTCEAHFDGSRENYFLPWHRMFVQFFEDIIRQTTAKSDFTLPYWDYTDPARRALPEEFLKMSDPKWGSLYRPSRNAHVNGGKRIDADPPAAEISLAAMRSGTYEDNGSDAGFCANLDGRLHGAVHVNIGNIVGMGRVPWAAADPIFWLHHCNIDRVWASWVKAGGTNPDAVDFLAETFNFANGSGKAEKAKVADFLQLKAYAYDNYLDRPANSVPFSKIGPQLVAQRARFDSASGIKLSSKATAVQLGPPTQGPGGGPLPAASISFKDLPSEAILYLRLEGISAPEEVLASYDVYVGVLDNRKLTREDPSYAGSVNFFGATHTHGGMHRPTGAARKLSFVLSNEARQLLASQTDTRPQVIFVPRGNAGRAQPLIERISIISS